MVLKGAYIGGHTVYGGNPVSKGIAMWSFLQHSESESQVHVPISSVGYGHEVPFTVGLPRSGERKIG